MENVSILEEESQKGLFLTFALGSESFGLEITEVKEIVGMQPITPLPETPAYVKGIINLRGRIIPVIDIRLRFGKEGVAYTDRTCIIVVYINGAAVGLIVDNVSEVLTIQDDQIVPPPKYGAGAQNRYLKAIGKVGNEVKLLLDCNTLLNAGDMNMLQNLGGEQ